MRQYCCLFVICFSLGFANSSFAQYSIPDSNFVKWLNLNGYSQCLSGNQLITNCEAVLNTLYLNCSNSKIHDLNGLQFFINLETLICESDSLASLPDLPYKLRNLDCAYNQLTSLPAFPASLQTIDLLDNKLISLPALPTALSNLVCEENHLTGLPALPAGLNYLYCDHNDLASLPELPDYMAELWCFDNPNLTCLPWLKTISQDLAFDSTAISCIPNYGHVAMSEPPLNSFPLCDSTNPNHCNVANSVHTIKAMSLSIYPNPATSRLIIQSTPITGKKTFNIISTDGRVVTSNLSTERESISIDISALSNGLYFIIIYSNDEVITKKFMKEQ